MSEQESLGPLLAALGDVMAWLQDGQVPGVIVGGVAASLLGRPRTTVDVDALVMLDEGRWQEFLSSGKRFGFAPRVADCLAFAQQSRVLLVDHQPSGVGADIVFGALPFEQEVIDRAVWQEVAGIRFRIPTAEDLIIIEWLHGQPTRRVDTDEFRAMPLARAVEEVIRTALAQGWTAATHMSVLGQPWALYYVWTPEAHNRHLERWEERTRWRHDAEDRAYETTLRRIARERALVAGPSEVDATEGEST